MAKPPSLPRTTAADPKGERETRLAAALRANLRRRKAQARARETVAEDADAESLGPAGEAAPQASGRRGAG